MITGTKSGDYHDEMNAENFMKWLESQLEPNLPPRSVLVVDNASYHNIKLGPEPTFATNSDNFYTKPEIFAIVKEHKSKESQYLLDDIIYTWALGGAFTTISSGVEPDPENVGNS